MVREQSVSVDVVELTLTGMWEAKRETVLVLRCIKTEQVVQPALNWVSLSIPDWLIQTSFKQRPTSEVTLLSLMRNSHLVLFTQALQKLKGQAASSALITVNRRRKDYHVWTKHLLDKCDWNRSCLINDQELSLGQLGMVLRLDVLNRLPVILEDVDSDNGVVPVSVSRLQDVIIRVLAIVECI